MYAASTAVVGPLASFAEPHSYDLCEEHAVRLTAPRGWEVVRHAGEFPAPIPHADDLEALADAVREAARVESANAAGSGVERAGESAAGEPGGLLDPLGELRTGRRGHLRVVPPRA